MTSFNEIRRWFLDDAERLAQLDRRAIGILLDTIMAPTDIKALFLVLDHLPEVLKVTERICHLDDQQEEFLHQAIKPTLATCQALLKHRGNFEKNALLRSLFATPGKLSSECLHGKLEMHPLYSALGHRAPSGVEKHYDHLLAHVLLATHQIQTSSSDEIERLVDSYRAVRYLSKPRSSKHLLELPLPPISSTEFLKAALSVRQSSLLQDAANILIKAQIGFKKRQPRSKDTPQDQQSGPSTSENDVDDEDEPTTGWPAIESVGARILTERETSDYCEQGGVEDELHPPRDHIAVPAQNERTYSGPTLRELAFQAKQRSNQLAIRNQLSPLSWNELNQFDLSILLKYFSGEGPQDLLPPDRENDIRTVLALMFWASSPLERILLLPFFPVGTPKGNSPEGIFWNGGQAPLIRLHSPGAPLQSKTLKGKFRLAHPVIQYSHIPLPEHACDTLRATAPWIHSKTEERHPLLPAGIDLKETTREVQSHIRITLGNLNKTHGCRLSMGRVNTFLLHAMARHPGEDLPSAMLFFGHRERIAVTRMHYTVAPLLRLENTYRQVCLQKLSCLDKKASFTAANPVNNLGTYLGTPFCPKTESIKSLVRSMQSAMEASRPRGGDSTLLLFHTHFAIYTAMFIAFATGYRAIHDPSFDQEDIDPAAELAIISDKDNDEHYNCRLVWIAESCQQQIRNYRRHLIALFDHLGPTSPPVYNLFKEHSRPGRPLQLFFFKQEPDQTEILKPGILGQLMRTIHEYDLPMNANRHYLKNELLRSGCSPEIIEAFLGHWEQGQEPWSGQSSLHPLVFREQIKKHLDPILDRDDWKPVEGFAK